MAIFLLHLQQVKLYIALWTEIDGLGLILSNRYPVFLQVACSLEQSPHNIHQLCLREEGILQFFLLHSCLESKVVVIAEGMDLLMLDAHLIF